MKKKIENNPLQWKGSFLKEDTLNSHLLTEVRNCSTYRAESWFEMCIGQLVYVVRDDFTGAIEIVNKSHCKRLFALQNTGYNFFTLAGIAEKIAPKENHEHIFPYVSSGLCVISKPQLN